MRPKHIFAILLLVSVGLIVVLLIHAMPHRIVTVAVSPAPQEEILVAARPLSAGLLLREQDVTWLARSGPAQEGDILRPSAETRAAKPESDEARTAVYGAALRADRAEHQPIRRSTIVKPGDRDFLATVLTPGTRALTIPVSAAAGGTGLMFPGDHVDVMLTQSFKNEDAPLTRRSVSETVVENLRVLAIDTSTKSGAGGNALTVTVEVLPQQAEKINVAQELGKLSLTLRSLDEPAAAMASPETPTWAGDVSPALNSAQPPPKVKEATKPEIKVMRGNNSVDTKAE